MPTSYHSESPSHDTNNCWALKNKVQDLIEAKEIEFDAPGKPNIITTPMPKHGHGVNAVEDDLFVTSVEDISTPLMTVKKNLLLSDLFPGCGKGCHLCSVLPTGCPLLKSGVQRMMNNKEILFEKTVVPLIPIEDVSIITIFANSSKAPRESLLELHLFRELLH